MKKINVGISSCLLGLNVRYDGSHKHNSYITGTLGEYFEFLPFCPEVEIGLGTPRPTVHLVNKAGLIRSVGVKNPELDITDRLREHAERLNSKIAQLSGYIVKKDSPSCGMERVKVYADNANRQPSRDGVGIFTQTLMQNNPLLPVEEEGRLGDPGLRENFIQRIYVYHRWQQMVSEGLSVQKLTTFHARHKLIIMSHGDYQELGQLAANTDKHNLQENAQNYIAKLMPLLRKVASRNQHVNVLQHIQGYLKKELDSDDKAELCNLIERYRNAEVPLIVPITLLKHHFRKAPDPYIENSYYLSPYPEELCLSNQV